MQSPRRRRRSKSPSKALDYMRDHVSALFRAHPDLKDVRGQQLDKFVATKAARQIRLDGGRAQKSFADLLSDDE